MTPTNTNTPHAYFTFADTSVGHGSKCPLVQELGSGITANAGEIRFDATGVYEVHFNARACSELALRAEYSGIHCGPLFRAPAGNQVSGHLMIDVTDLDYGFSLFNVSEGNRALIGTMTIRRTP